VNKRWNLGLLGKGIQHSLSPSLYLELINKDVNYELFDYDSAEKIPKLDFFSQKLDGLNITSPYKHFFDGQVALHGKLEKLYEKNLIGFNCLKFSNFLRPVAFNSDYFALEKLLPYYIKKWSSEKIIILGGGVMAHYLVNIAQEKKITYDLLTRQSHGDLTFFDLSNYPKSLVINTCSRDFRFKGVLHSSSRVWDLNYGYDHKFSVETEDGVKLLREQAIIAANFFQGII
jgi:shikimate dehydrogenase